MTELEIVIEILKYYGAICIGSEIFMIILLIIRKIFDKDYELLDSVQEWLKIGFSTYVVIIPAIVIGIVGLVCVVASVLWAFGLL